MTFNKKKYLEINNLTKKYVGRDSVSIPKIIAVSKNHPISSINEAINEGVLDFAENKVQEAIKKFKILKESNNSIVLHMTGALQTNKVKAALNIFDYFHTLDREKLAKEFNKNLSNNVNLSNKNFFVQINTGNELQKSGISINQSLEFIRYCQFELNLNVVGIMCIPPINDDPKIHFKKMSNILIKSNLQFLSMGMSADYKTALDYGSTHIRIGTALFGNRKDAS